MTRAADVIIVGAGSAGCVLASRISEDRGVQVLLLEAGRDFPPGAEPDDIGSIYPLSYFNPAYRWDAIRASWSDGRAAVPFVQGKGVGGSSSIMGMWAVRGFPQDYDAWHAAGATGWGWSDVVPYFRRAERDLDFGGELHGEAGPIVIRRQGMERAPPFCTAVARAAQDAGLHVIADMNATFTDGICALPIAAGARRVSAAAAYLTSAVRKRPNLRIESGAHCRRILFDGTRAVGVEVVDAGGRRVLRAAEVILSAGALHSPWLLVRSGVGPREGLEHVGVAPVKWLPGVGENLQNHCAVHLGMHLHSHAVDADTRASAAYLCLRTSSSPGSPSDLYLSVLNRSSWHHFGRRLATINAMLHKPHSRGRVRWAQGSPEAVPQADFAFLSDLRDLDRMATAVRRAADMMADAQVQALGRRSGLVIASRASNLLANRTAFTRFGNAIASAMMPLLPALEEGLVAPLLSEWPLARLRTADRDQLRTLLKRVVTGVFHAVGTCRMGAASDATAVVDATGRVHGIQGLRVADASVMPEIPRGGTFLPTVMLAEKIAEAVRKRLGD